MKRILVGLLAASALIGAAAPAAPTLLANAIGTPGKPVYAVSNTGSAQAQANRSTTGTSMKTTNDHVEWIWD